MSSILRRLERKRTRNVVQKCMFCSSTKDLIAPSLYNSDWFCQECQNKQFDGIIKQREKEGKRCRKVFVCGKCNKVVELNEEKKCSCSTPSFFVGLQSW